MLILKVFIYSLIFLTCSFIGLIKSQKYSDRVYELREFKNALNMFRTKIKFTYEPIPEIFSQIAQNLPPIIGGIFKVAGSNMNLFPAGEAWRRALDTEILSITEEDRNILKDFSRLLGETDMAGQLSQVEITYSFLEEQIIKAEKEKQKNESMYRKLGMIVGLGIVIVLL